MGRDVADDAVVSVERSLYWKDGYTIKKTPLLPEESFTFIEASNLILYKPSSIPHRKTDIVFRAVLYLIHGFICLIDDLFG
jgi:hypothetical protein